MDAFWFALLLVLIKVCTETVITVLLRIVFEKTHPSYIVYNEDGTVSVYIYQVVMRHHKKTECRYLSERLVWKNGKWRSADEHPNTRVDIIVSSVLLLFVVFYLIVMLGGELLANIHIILVMVIMMLLFGAPTLILHHVIVHSVLKRLLREA